MANSISCLERNSIVLRRVIGVQLDLYADSFSTLGPIPRLFLREMDPS